MQVYFLFASVLAILDSVAYTEHRPIHRVSSNRYNKNLIARASGPRPFIFKRPLVSQFLTRKLTDEYANVEMEPEIIPEVEDQVQSDDMLAVQDRLSLLHSMVKVARNDLEMASTVVKQFQSYKDNLTDEEKEALFVLSQELKEGASQAAKSALKILTQVASLTKIQDEQ